jgi:hypothetical protein
MIRPTPILPRAAARALCAALPAFALAACAGGDPAAPGASAAVGASATLAVATPATSPAARVAPTFHLAPVLLDEPPDAADATRLAHAAAARNGRGPAELDAPHRQPVPAEFAGLSTRRLLPSTLESIRREGRADGADAPAGAAPLAAGTVVATYSPAQIRAAYGLPALPAAGTTLTAAQAAQFGAGQTVYVVAAQHDPNVAAELATFSQKFGLPACAGASLAPGAALPLAPAGAGCTLALAYVTGGGALTATAPAYDAGWATEIALDVQWVHAIAPLARIVLIEAPDAGVNTLAAAVGLANAMGPGVVSMSFGAPEGSWTGSLDGAFAGAGMTYLAATGDNGTDVEWPAVSPRVLGVGGTSLTWTGVAPRAETAWSGSGGGVSQYVALPAWQGAAVPGFGSAPRRAVSDVSMNADPTTGQYVAVLAPGATTASWVSAGGTSLSTPQWAGLIAVANALRAQAGLAPVGAVSATLYGLSQQAGYAQAFNDVAAGSNGTCTGCTAGLGFDLPTGLGSPNATALFGQIAAPPPPVAPGVASTSVAGTAGVSLAFTLTANAPHAVAWALANAPSGMAVDASGRVTWPVPVAGSYAVTAVATDTTTGLRGQGTVAVSIQPPAPPTVAGATVSGTAGTAVAYAVVWSGPNPVTWTFAGAPAGVSISTAGVLAWSAPVAGSYAVTVTARDTKTGLSGSGVVTLAIAAPKAPTVAGGSVSGVAGRALSFQASATAPNPVSWTLSGAPAGMSIAATGVVSWAAPVAGRYAVKATAKDTKTGLSGSGSYTVTIAPPGPVLSATALTGVAGRPLSGTIAVSDATSTSVSLTISGVPPGMTFAPVAGAVNVSWPAPVAGSYTLRISAKDGNGLTAAASVPVTISR